MRLLSAVCPLLLILPLLLLPSDALGEDRVLRRVKRVINGQRMGANEFPWLVSIRGRFWRKLYGFIPIPMVEICGASLLNDRWLLSAAHCFQEKINGRRVSLNNPSKWKAYLASKRRTPGIKEWLRHLAGKILRKKKWYMWRLDIEKIIIHPQFVYRSGDGEGQLHYDIALLKMKESVPHREYQTMNPASLPTRALSRAGWPDPGTNCTFAGWGCTKKGGKAVKFATKVNFRVIEDARCLTTYSNKYVNLNNDMCAGAFNGNKGICPGDSGGPLICYHNGTAYQAGVASATAASAPADYPGIFTRLSTFRSWIITTMRYN